MAEHQMRDRQESTGLSRGTKYSSVDRIRQQEQHKVAIGRDYSQTYKRKVQRTNIEQAAQPDVN